MATHPRRRSRDLFPTDGPVEADQLIGRAADVDELANALHNGVNRILVGPRRTGKTSVALAAVEELRARGDYVVSLDLFRIGSQAELAEMLVRGVIANRSAPHRASAAVRRATRTVAAATTRAISATVATDLGEEVEIAFTAGLAARDPDRYLTYALELPQQIAELDDTQIVLFIDEFQEIASARSPFGDPDALTKRMRSVLQSSRRVTSLFAGSIEHLMRDLFTPANRAFYRFGAYTALAPISADEWRTGITTRLRTDRTTIAPLALAELLRGGDGHPRATMLLAQQAHALSVLLGVKRIDADLGAEAYVEAMVADSVSHQTDLERIRELGRHSFDVVRRVARGTPPYAGTAPKAAQRALTALERAGFIERRLEPGPSWRIVDPLLRDFLAAT